MLGTHHSTRRQKVWGTGRQSWNSTRFQTSSGFVCFCFIFCLLYSICSYWLETLSSCALLSSFKQHLDNHQTVDPKFSVRLNTLSALHGDEFWLWHGLNPVRHLKYIPTNTSDLCSSLSCTCLGLVERTHLLAAVEKSGGEPAAKTIAMADKDATSPR